MKSAGKAKFAEKFLAGLFLAGLVLVAGTSLITGKGSVADSLTPFVILGCLWFGLRAKGGKGQGHAG